MPKRIFLIIIIPIFLVLFPVSVEALSCSDCPSTYPGTYTLSRDLCAAQAYPCMSVCDYPDDPANVYCCCFPVPTTLPFCEDVCSASAFPIMKSHCEATPDRGCTKDCKGIPGDVNIYCCCKDTQQSPGTLPSPTGLQNLGELITKASGVTTPLAVVGFIFTVIYAGFVRMTAAGNPDKEGKSMKIAIGAAVGFAIIALAPLFVRIMASLLDIDTTLVT